MHETMSSGFKGHIDQFYAIDGNVRIAGWLVSELPRDSISLYLETNGHYIEFYNFNVREDVANYYNTTDNDYKQCGFDLTIPYKGSDHLKIFAKTTQADIPVFELNLNPRASEPVQTQMLSEPVEFKINNNIVPQFIVVDNFYQDPYAVRELALKQSFDPDLRYYKGKRSRKFIAEGTKEVFESLIGRKITKWSEYDTNGVFQYCTAEDPLVYHSDLQSYAAAVYLTPDAPVESGTSFYRSKIYPDIRECHYNDSMYQDVFKGGFYDKTQFELVDTVGNVFNRLAIWNSKLIHSASQYFGTELNNARLFHLFFFDIEE